MLIEPQSCSVVGLVAPPCIAVCVPMHWHPTRQFHESWRLLRKVGSYPNAIPGVGTHYLSVPGFSVETARAMLTEQALLAEPRATHLLWIDDDMGFPADALARLMAHDLPIVGGLCHNRRPPYAPVLMRKHDPVWGFNEESYGFMFDYIPGELLEVDATGGAFILVRREVFDAVEAKFGKRSWWLPEGDRSEDISFMERVRACGYKIFVDTSLEIGHVTEVVLTSKEARALRPFELNRWNPKPPEAKQAPAVASIIIPTYNQDPKLLKAAVYSALGQTVPVEVIVVDDGTTDYEIVAGGAQKHTEAAAVTRDTPIPLPLKPTVSLPRGVKLLHHKENCGISAALNAGIEAMTTEWFCWLSSDDLLDPRKVEIQLGAVRTAGAKCSFTRYGAIRSGAGDTYQRFAQLPGWRTLIEQKRILAEGCAINGSTVMIHKSVFAELGRFDPEFRYGQDWEMWCRIGQKYPWLQVDEVLGTRRENGNLTQLIAREDATGERRKRRDQEDELIRMRYAAQCSHCGKPLR